MSADAAIDARRTMRAVLIAFLLTFIAARVTVFLIMARRIPDLFLHLGGTHVHHLSYGIFLLSGVGLYLLLRQPSGRTRTPVAALYGVGLALTFDEFGMWLHLGGGYWQRASFDAVVVIAAALGTLVYAPALKRFRPLTWATVAMLVAALALFGVLLMRSFRYAGERFGPRIERLEQQGPR
jgi:hypothetical protein